MKDILCSITYVKRFQKHPSIYMGKKAFQRHFNVGVELINAVQEIYLANEVTTS
jgi:hypothetical protein